MKKSRCLPVFLFFLFLTLTILPASPTLSFQTMQMKGTTRGKTAGPAATKVSPKRAKAVHKATPKSLLCVKRITISPKAPHVGDKVAIHALIANNGPRAVKEVKVNLYLGKVVVAWQVYNIGSKGSQEYVGYFTKTQAPKAGSYTVSALVDPDRSLERTFYKCNTALLHIKILPPVFRMSTQKRTVNKRQVTPRAETRHAFIRPGRAVEKGRPAKAEMKGVKSSPRPAIRKIKTGEIRNVTVRIQSHHGTATKNIRGKNKAFGHTLDIRWVRKGLLPGQVDIFLYPVRQAHRGIYLRRNAANTGHCIATASTLKERQSYVIRIQTHDGKVHGESRPFSCPFVHLSAVGTHTKSASSTHRAGAGGKAATPISIPRTADLKKGRTSPKSSANVKLDPGIGPTGMKADAKNATRHLSHSITIPNAVTYDSAPGGGGSAPPGGGAWGYDIACSIGRVNGVVPVDKKTRKVMIKVENNGVTMTPPFKVGLGIKGKAKIGNSSSWLKTATVVRGGVLTGHFILITFELPKNVTEKTNLIAGADIAAKVQEKNENNNYSKPFNIQYQKANYAGGTDKPDLIPSIQTSNETYSGDGKSLIVNIWNNSKTAARGFSVGFCLASKANAKNITKWLGSKKITFLGPHNSMLVSIPWQVHTLGNNEKYVAITDIFQDINEGKIGEQNNRTPPFGYQVTTTLVPPPILGNPIEGFDVTSVGRPDDKNNFRRDQDRTVSIIFKVKNHIRNNPTMLGQLSDRVRISLIRLDGSEALSIVEKACYNKINVSNFWYWNIPADTPIGRYRVCIKTEDGHYEGKSKPIKIWEPTTVKVANTLEKNANLVPKHFSKNTARKLKKLGKPYLPPEGIEPLRFSTWKIQSLVPRVVVLNGQYSKYARLSSLDIVIQYNANKPFKFSRLMPNAEYYPDAEWSYAELVINVDGKLDKQVPWDAESFTGYPWSTYFAMDQKLINHIIHYPKGIQPAGTHRITLKIEEVGIVNGVKVVGKIKGSGTKCEVWYLPHIKISVSAQTHTPYYSLVTDNITHTFSPPPCWNLVDMVHWAIVYPSFKSDIFRPGECR